MFDSMATVDEVELLPDAEQHKLLVATLERVNRASNAARAAALQRNTFEGAGLREVVKEEVERAKLPDGFVRPILDRVEASLRRRAGKQPKFSQFQSLTLPAVGVQVGRLRPRHDPHRGRTAHDLGARRPQPRRPAAAALRPAREHRVPQRRVRAARGRRRTRARRLNAARSRVSARSRVDAARSSA